MAKRRRERRRAPPGGALDAPFDADVAEARRIAERRVALLGELARYAVTSGLLLFFLPGVGALVALFWGISLARRYYAEVAAPRLRRRWIERELAGGRTPARGAAEGARAPTLAALPFAECVEAALAARAARLAGGGVELRREGTTGVRVQGDAELLGRALAALLDAALAALSARPGPRRLDVELGESLDGSEAWLRLRARAGGGGERGAAPALPGVEEIAEVQGGRLESHAAADGLEWVLALRVAS
jgi:hypothetical protein